MKKNILILFALIFSLHASAQKDSLQYRVVLMFGSYADGVPDAKPVFDYISTFKKKYRIKKIAYDRVGPMGREGEYWLAFPLKELTKSQTTVFVNKISLVVKNLPKPGYVNIEEKSTIARADYAGKVERKKI